MKKRKKIQGILLVMLLMLAIPFCLMAEQDETLLLMPAESTEVTENSEKQLIEPDDEENSLADQEQIISGEKIIESQVDDPSLSLSAENEHQEESNDAEPESYEDNPIMEISQDVQVSIPISYTEKPVRVTVGIRNETSLSDIVFCLTYDDSIGQPTDYCALTPEKETSLGLISGGKVEILSNNYDTTSGRRILRFRSTKGIPFDKTITCLANVVQFEKVSNNAAANDTIILYIERGESI